MIKINYESDFKLTETTEEQRFADVPFEFVYSMDYDGVKTKLITSRYSNDDQMALILNHGKSDEDTEFFDKMQAWRDWAGLLAKKKFSL